MSYDAKAAAVRVARIKRSQELGWGMCGHSKPCNCEVEWLQGEVERQRARLAEAERLLRGFMAEIGEGEVLLEEDGVIEGSFAMEPWLAAREFLSEERE